MIGLLFYGETPLTDVTTLKETTEQDLTKLTSREGTAPTRRVTTVTIMRPKYPARPNAKFAPFRVVMDDDGSTLIESNRDPEFAAARELLARGITGELQTKHEGSDTICMKLDIEKAAMRTTVENFSTSPIVQAYRPYMFEARTDTYDDESDLIGDGAIRHFPPSPLTQGRTEVRVGR